MATKKPALTSDSVARKRSQAKPAPEVAYFSARLSGDVKEAVDLFLVRHKMNKTEFVERAFAALRKELGG